MIENNNNSSVSLEQFAEQLATFQKFVARRFDEISMEVNATSQQVDMAEEGIGRRFAEIFEIIKAVSFSGDGKTPANAGVELDAVIEVTEKAAETILSAAEAISDIMHGPLSDASSTEAEKEGAKIAIDQQIQDIIIACTFQDLTGQRIQQTLKSLKSIEDRLNSALEKIGVNIEDQSVQSSPVSLVEGRSQEDIDKMFDGDFGKSEPQTQSAIDDMFADARSKVS